MFFRVRLVVCTNGGCLVSKEYGPFHTQPIREYFCRETFISETPRYLTLRRNITEPGHDKMCLMSYVNNKGADQTAHPHSLISAFVVRCLDSIISLDSIAEISRL